MGQSWHRTSYGKVNENHELGTGFFIRESYQQLRG
jgi:hypothetical protein